MLARGARRRHSATTHRPGRRPRRHVAHRRRLRGERHRGRRPRTQAPESRRRVPPPHRAQGRGRDRRDGRGPVMTTLLTSTRPPIAPPSMLRASGTIVWRNLIHIKRMPEMLLDVTVQSVMFVLLFAYVFGGSIQPPGGVDYKEFLLPGIMVQTMIFTSAIAAMGLTNDLQKGIVDRLKSLPISRSSVLVGRSISSLIHSSIGIAVMGATGLLIGWRVRGSVADAVLGFVLILMFGFAMIWLGIYVGSLMRTVEAVQGFMFTVMFQLTFVANTFSPP